MATLVQYNRVPAFVNPFYGAYGRPAINRYPSKSNVPAVNVKDTETAFQLELAAPGMKKDALKLTAEANTLTIAYQPQAAADQTAETFTRHEFGVNAFTRSFRLPKHVNVDQITAAYTDGILTVTLPKVVVNEEKVVKEIAIA